MTIGNALTFIDTGMRDELFRAKLNGATSKNEIQGILNSENMIFEGFEFEDAFNKRHLECQEKEDADRLNEFKIWWDLLLQFV